MQLKTSDGSFLSMSVDDLDTQSLVKGLGMDVSVANLEESLHPLLHSTPNPNWRRESILYQGRKRQRIAVDTADPYMKDKGMLYQGEGIHANQFCFMPFAIT